MKIGFSLIIQFTVYLLFNTPFPPHPHYLSIMIVKKTYSYCSTVLMASFTVLESQFSRSRKVGGYTVVVRKGGR